MAVVVVVVGVVVVVADGRGGCSWCCGCFLSSGIKEVNTVPKAIPVWPTVLYISDTNQYRCIISNLSLFYIILSCK